jgi:hypothetical protein
MTTPLHSTLRRSLAIDGREYVVTLTSEALKLTLKGKRRGVELAWANLVNGEAALAVALQASLGAFPPAGQAKSPTPAPRHTSNSKTKGPHKKTPAAARSHDARQSRRHPR